MKNLVFFLAIGAIISTANAQKGTLFKAEDENYIDSLGLVIGDIKLRLDTLDENYYVISGQGVAGNIGVFVGEEGVYMVDNQWSALSARIKQMIRQITNKPIKLIVNTHYHFDHSNGNIAFSQEGIPILAHSKARERMQRRQVLHGFNSVVQNPYPSEGLPTMTFMDKVELYDGDEIIELKYFPNAHTDGDIIVHFKKADIYHMGDIFVSYGIPVIDPDAGGNIYALIETIDYIISTSKQSTKFIPGHGSICSKSDLIVFSELLHLILESVEYSYRQGKDLDQTIAFTKIQIGENVGGINKDIFISLVYKMVIDKENQK